MSRKIRRKDKSENSHFCEKEYNYANGYMKQQQCTETTCNF